LVPATQLRWHCISKWLNETLLSTLRGDISYRTRFGAFTVVMTKIQVFWDVMPMSGPLHPDGWTQNAPPK